MFKNIFKKNRNIQIDKILKEAKKSEKEFKNKENSNKIEEDLFEDLEKSVDLEDLECILEEETVEEKIKKQNEINESIINEERKKEEEEKKEEELLKFTKKEKAYEYPNTQNSYFKNSSNDLFHDNVLIYGKEDYFANQSIFRVIKENLRNGTGLIWFVNESEFLNVSEMIKSDSEFFEYKDRVFTAFEIKESFLENDKLKKWDLLKTSKMRNLPMAREARREIFRGILAIFGKIFRKPHRFFLRKFWIKKAVKRVIILKN